MSVSFPTVSRAVAPHGISVPVTPAIAVVSSSAAAASVLATLEPHHFLSGDTVLLAGHLGSTPLLDGLHVVTVLGPLTFSVPVVVTVGGAGGLVTRTIAAEPLTLAEGKLRAGLDWVDGDPRDGLMRGFISAARSKVEQDTGLALLTQTRDVYFDALPGRAWFSLPSPSAPLQAVLRITSLDAAGVLQTLAGDQYLTDLASSRIALAPGAAWPADLRPFQPWQIRIVVGWTAPALIPPLLVHAVGLLTAHYATTGRDLATVGTIIAPTLQGYEDAISAYLPVVVP